jgi:hypothetical protein
MEVFIHEHLGHGLAGSAQSTKHLSHIEAPCAWCSGVWQEALSLSWELCLKSASLFHSKIFRSFVFLANLRDVGLQARLVRVDLPDLSVVRGLTSIWIPSLRQSKYVPTLCHVITTRMAKCTGFSYTVAGAIRPARI